MTARTPPFSTFGDDGVFVTVLADNSVCVWSSESGDLQRKLAESMHLDAGYTCVAYASFQSKKQKQVALGLVAVGTIGGKVVVWDVQAGEVVKRLNHSRAGVAVVDVAVRGSVLYSLSADGLLNAWSLDSFALLNSITVEDGVGRLDMCSVESDAGTSAPLVRVAGKDIRTIFGMQSAHSEKKRKTKGKSSSSASVKFDQHAHSKQVLVGRGGAITALASSPDGRISVCSTDSDRYASLFDQSVDTSTTSKKKKKKGKKRGRESSAQVELQAAHSFHLNSAVLSAACGPALRASKDRSPTYWVAFRTESQCINIFTYDAKNRRTVSVRPQCQVQLRGASGQGVGASGSGKSGGDSTVQKSSSFNQRVLTARVRDRGKTRVGAGEGPQMLNMQFVSPADGDVQLLVACGTYDAPVFRVCQIADEESGEANQLQASVVISAQTKNVSSDSASESANKGVQLKQTARVHQPGSLAGLGGGSLTSVFRVPKGLMAESKTQPLLKWSATFRDLYAQAMRNVDTILSADFDPTPSSDPARGNKYAGRSVESVLSELGLKPVELRDPNTATVSDQRSDSAPVLSNSLRLLLGQALRSQDVAMIEYCIHLGVQRPEVIAPTIAQTPVHAVLPLLQILTRKFHLKPHRGNELLPWIRALLSIHSLVLLRCDDSDVHRSLLQLRNALEARCKMAHRLSQLRGKLELLLTQAHVLQTSRHAVVSSSSLTTRGADGAEGVVTVTERQIIEEDRLLQAAVDDDAAMQDSSDEGPSEAEDKDSSGGDEEEEEEEQKQEEPAQMDDSDSDSVSDSDSDSDSDEKDEGEAEAKQEESGEPEESEAPDTPPVTRSQTSPKRTPAKAPEIAADEDSPPVTRSSRKKRRHSLPKKRTKSRSRKKK